MQPLPAWIADFRLAPEPGERYYPYLIRSLEALDTALGGALFLDGHLLTKFFERELVVPGYYRKAPPPVELYPNFVPTLALAMLVRHGMVMQGFGPLQVIATYRPIKGATNSLHKVNRAIDLSPVKKTPAACRALMQCARWAYQQHGHLAVGVGTYGAHIDRTTLIHLDICGRKGRKSWRHLHGVSVASAVRGKPAALAETPSGG